MDLSCLLYIPYFSHAVGEDKPKGEMQEAVLDITSKMADMSAVHYGPLPFIMAYSAAGMVVQFHSVFWKNDGRQVNLGSSRRPSQFMIIQITLLFFVTAWFSHAHSQRGNSGNKPG